MRLLRWLRDRFRPAEVPAGWDVDSLDEIRPHFSDPWEVEDTSVLIVVDEHLGTLVLNEPPARPVRLFEGVDAEQPVAWDWEPAWLRELAVT